MKPELIYTREHIVLVCETSELENGDIVYYKHPLHNGELFGMLTTIIDKKYSTYKPYEVHHEGGYGVKEGYKKALAYQPLFENHDKFDLPSINDYILKHLL